MDKDFKRSGFPLEALLELTNMNDIPRCHSIPRIKNESVAAHSFFVAVLSYVICTERGNTIDFTRSCVLGALFHDMEEIFTGDIPHQVLRMGDVAEQIIPAALKGVNQLFDEIGIPLEEEYKDKHTEIVMIADMLAFLLYSYKDVMLFGNRSRKMVSAFYTGLKVLNERNVDKVLDVPFSEIAKAAAYEMESEMKSKGVRACTVAMPEWREL